MTMPLQSPAWSLACTLLAAALPAQDPLWVREGIGGQVRLGVELQRLGDIDGDGWEDFLEWGTDPAPTTPPFGNVIRVVSSRDGSVISTSPLLQPLQTYTYQRWSMTPAGDMNGDGKPDYAVSIYYSNAPDQRIEVRSGVDHSPIWTATIPQAWQNLYGWAIGADLDLDGDGRGDVVTSATRLSPLGTLIAYDNAGIELYRVVDPLPGVLLATDLAPLGADLDRDGCDEYLAAGPDVTTRGVVAVLSGRTGAILQVSMGERAFDKLSFATGCGDLDGDGVVDYAGGGFWGAAVVTAFSGATGRVIHTWRDPGSYTMGEQLTGGFDLDQDGVPDLVTGAFQEWAHALSGRDGTFLYSIRNSRLPGRSGIGSAHILLAPPPGERYPLHVFSEHEWSSPANPGLPGLLWAVRGSPVGVRGYGDPRASHDAFVARIGMRLVPPGTLRTTISSAPASTAAIRVLGVSDTGYAGAALPLSLAGFGLPHMQLLCSADACAFALTGRRNRDRGYASSDLRLPAGMQLGATGTALFCQWLWLDLADLTRHGSTAAQRFHLR